MRVPLPAAKMMMAVVMESQKEKVRR